MRDAHGSVYWEAANTGKSAAYYIGFILQILNFFFILIIVSESTIFIIIYEYIKKHCKILTIHSQITMFTYDLQQYVFRYVSILKLWPIQ